MISQWPGEGVLKISILIVIFLLAQTVLGEVKEYKSTDNEGMSSIERFFVLEKQVIELTTTVNKLDSKIFANNKEIQNLIQEIKVIKENKDIEKMKTELTILSEKVERLTKDKTK
jgi:uncharacterized membrane protein